MPDRSKTDYTAQWPVLRVEWAQEKLAKWRAKLADMDSPPTHVEKLELEHDISCMERVLADWEVRAAG